MSKQRKSGQHDPLFNRMQIKRIRALYEWRGGRAGNTQQAIADMFGASQATIFKVVNRLPPYDHNRKQKRRTHENLE